MMQTRPLVSIVIPTRNAGERFRDVLAAIRAQEPAGPEVEIVVVEDHRNAIAAELHVALDSEAMPACRLEGRGGIFDDPLAAIMQAAMGDRSVEEWLCAHGFRLVIWGGQGLAATTPR